MTATHDPIALANSDVAKAAVDRWAEATDDALAAHLRAAASVLLDETTEADAAQVLDDRAAFYEAADRLQGG
jgi:hypothetical protein